MAPIGSVSSVALSRVSNGDTDDASIAMASKALSQVKQEGSNAVALIQTAKAPPTGDHRGQLVNTAA
ncbi:MAG: hypothetical protein WCJ30_22885 [Deltaproteobacteria bacterium]